MDKGCTLSRHQTTLEQPVGVIQGLTQSRVAVKRPRARAGHVTRKHDEKKGRSKGRPFQISGEITGPRHQKTGKGPGHEPVLLTARPFVSGRPLELLPSPATLYIYTTMAHLCNPNPHARITPHVAFPPSLQPRMSNSSSKHEYRVCSTFEPIFGLSSLPIFPAPRKNYHSRLPGDDVGRLRHKIHTCTVRRINSPRHSNESQFVLGLKSPVTLDRRAPSHN